MSALRVRTLLRKVLIFWSGQSGRGNNPLSLKTRSGQLGEGANGQETGEEETLSSETQLTFGHVGRAVAVGLPTTRPHSQRPKPPQIFPVPFVVNREVLAFL